MTRSTDSVYPSRLPRAGAHRSASADPARVQGFTLIEVLVTVLIIGILSGIAYPNYAEYVRRGQRTEARTMLLDAAQFLQRVYSVNDRYDRQRDGTPVTLPTAMSQVPAQGNARYTIVIAESTATSYRLEARPTGAMSTDACGTFTLNSLGQRNVSGASKSREDCWR